MKAKAKSEPISGSQKPNDPADEHFEAVVRVYRPAVFRFALASLRDRDAAETVTQDCFYKAHKAWDTFRGEASLKSWLMQIAVNLVRDVARSRRFQFWRRAEAPPIAVADAGVSPEARASERQQVQAIWDVAARLPERQRTVFLLHFLEEMNAAEIEAATGISKAAIKVHLFRAVHAVRAKLGDRV